MFLEFIRPNHKVELTRRVKHRENSNKRKKDESPRVKQSELKRKALNKEIGQVGQEIEPKQIIQFHHHIQ